MVLRTLQLGTTEVLQNLLPVRRIVVAAQVRLELSSENLQCRTLANTVSPDQSKHLARTWSRQTVKLESVGCVTVRNFGVKVSREVNDGDCLEWASGEASTLVAIETSEAH